MDIFQWAIAPWGEVAPNHIEWFLIQVAFGAGVAFFVVHATYIRFFARKKEWSGSAAPEVVATIPERVPRHSRVARGFHWLMAASMFTLLFTAFLPKVGVEFPWVTYHWIAGTVLTASLVFHIIHASFWLDFWTIWPDKTDIVDAIRRLRRFVGQEVPAPRRFAKKCCEGLGALQFDQVRDERGTFHIEGRHRGWLGKARLIQKRTDGKQLFVAQQRVGRDPSAKFSGQLARLFH